MSELQTLIEACYEQAKRGEWGRVLTDWQELPLLAGQQGVEGGEHILNPA